MKTIHVQYPTAVLPSYATPEAAVGSVRTDPRNQLTAKEKQALQGATILAGGCTDDQLHFDLNSGFVLSIEANQGTVSWILRKSPEPATIEHEASVVTLQFARQSGESEDRLVVFDRPALVRDRLQRTLENLFASGTWLFMYIENAPILRFSALEQRNNSAPILFWDEVD
jgi:hypothetical protein